MTITTIEKAAKLMGLVYESIGGDVFVPETIPDLPDWRLFNPYTHKSDLMDVECELAEMYELNITIAKNIVVIRCFDYETPTEVCYQIQTVTDGVDSTRAHAVMAVVEQIYDAKFGGE